MTLLQSVQKAEQRRRALHQAQIVSLKAYRGVPYTALANAKPVSGRMTYRGSVYIK